MLTEKNFLNALLVEQICRKNASVKFNTGISLNELGATDVRSFTVSNDGKQVKHEFPTKYNVGSTKNVTIDGDTYLAAAVAKHTFTRDIRIKTSSVTGTDLSEGLYAEINTNKGDMIVNLNFKETRI